MEYEFYPLPGLVDTVMLYALGPDTSGYSPAMNGASREKLLSSRVPVRDEQKPEPCVAEVGLQRG